jgi:hypothetical protein
MNSVCLGKQIEKMDEDVAAGKVKLSVKVGSPRRHFEGSFSTVVVEVVSAPRNPTSRPHSILRLLEWSEFLLALGRAVERGDQRLLP